MALCICMSVLYAWWYLHLLTFELECVKWRLRQTAPTQLVVCRHADRFPTLATSCPETLRPGPAFIDLTVRGR